MFILCFANCVIICIVFYNNVFRFMLLLEINYYYYYFRSPGVRVVGRDRQIPVDIRYSAATGHHAPRIHGDRHRDPDHE